MSQHYLPTYPPTHTHTYPPNYPPTYPLTHPPNYLPTQLPTNQIKVSNYIPQCSSGEASSSSAKIPHIL